MQLRLEVGMRWHRRPVDVLGGVARRGLGVDQLGQVVAAVFVREELEPIIGEEGEKIWISDGWVRVNRAPLRWIRRGNNLVD